MMRSSFMWPLTRLRYYLPTTLTTVQCKCWFVTVFSSSCIGFNGFRMGIKFGNLGVRVNGLIYYSLSPHEQKAFAGFFSRGFPNTIRRMRSAIPLVVPREYRLLSNFLLASPFAVQLTKYEDVALCLLSWSATNLRHRGLSLQTLLCVLCKVMLSVHKSLHSF